MSLEGAQWRIVGFHDGYLGRSADTTIIPNEYRGDYLTGWFMYAPSECRGVSYIRLR
jgi:hypothetical protein